ncbi:DUF2254 domain-containing protein [Alteromonas sp. ASW11-130]|uniref:DUF2254 domain-containing protein n=1 Tax=Alteromonas sp. ASW11-130 TaxID=3015775 RepID=UPI0022422746|nr:DUF2254 domain-containing protein [Alteromonas sp. ASW11-130]MCW8092117.1 DUF2254 domain-containing protein [Alteromonas sp. ASW11-130]
MRFIKYKTRLRTIWEAVSTSYWFIPVLMMIGMSAVCLFCLFMVQRSKLPEFVINLIPLVEEEGARQLLSTLATAIITATSIAFSMTIVVLTMATAQFGPRLLRTFMLDKATQSVLGILVSSFLFCIIALHHLAAIRENAEALSIISTVTFFIGVVNLFALIFFIHHVSNAIQAEEVIHKSFVDFKMDLPTLLPKLDIRDEEEPVPERILPNAQFQISYFSEGSGYVQTINYEEFLNSKIKGICGFEILVRSGDYVMPGEKIVVIHSHYALTEKDLTCLNGLILLGHRRTPVQDPEFAVSQLVEIALRALSPGINDPFTAISCLDKLTSACILMSRRPFPFDTILNTEHQTWLKRRTFSLRGVIDMSFDQIRQSGKNHVAIGLHILHCLKKLTHHLSDEHKSIINNQANATYELLVTTNPSVTDREKIDHLMVNFDIKNTVFAHRN